MNARRSQALCEQDAIASASQGECEIAEGTLSAIAHCEARIIEVRGGVATGKSQALLERSRQLLQAGIPASSIFVACSTIDAARELEKRFALLCRHNAFASFDMPTFCTPVGLMRIYLQSHRMPGKSEGRTSRVLLDVEVKLLAQDLIARGCEPIALQHVLGAQQSDPAQPEEHLRRQENAIEKTRRTLDKALKARNAILQKDLPALCNRLNEAPPFPYLLIDDADTLSQDTLSALLSLAEKQCVLACSTPCTDIAGDCFNLGNYCSDSDASAVAASFENLALGKSFSVSSNTPRPPLGNDGSAIAVKWRDLQEESEGIALYLQHKLRECKALVARDIFVAVPNKMWANSIKQALYQRFIDSSIALDGQCASGDPRSRVSGARLQALSRLSLVADPLDIVSWRNLCAFQKKDFASKDWNQLEDWLHSRNTDLTEAVSKAIANGIGEPTLPEAPESAKDLIGFIASTARELSQLKEKRGFALAKAIGEGLDAEELDGFFNSIAGDEGATELHAHLWSLAFGRSFDPSLSKVHIGTLEGMAGLSPRILIVAGFNAGLYEEDLPLGARQLQTATGKARDVVMFSFIQKMEHETAAKIGCSIRRAKNEHGTRVAMLAPCPLLSRIGDFAPSQQSGQQFLGETTAKMSR